MRLRSVPLAMAAAAGILAGAVTPASAHGDHDWIRKGGFKGVDGTSCCGQDDCEAIAASRIDRTAEGYRLRDLGMTVPHRQVMRSEDGKFWLCRADRDTMRCFFAPPPGS